MCGVFGIVGARRPDRLEQRLASMRSAIKHRGPDGEGLAILSDGAAAMGHVRLAIIAPDEGAQPMADPSGRFHLSFNGAIYNFVELREELRQLGHSFATRSDTEVLLRAYIQWGRGCLSRLEGMYAFAIWDAQERALFLARDRFGEKPLFYAENGGELIFASEVGGVLAALETPAQVDPGAIADCLVFKYVPGERTMFRGVRQLPSDSWAVHDDRGLTIGCAEPQPREIGAPSAGDLREALDRSVRMRLRADVPIGLFLSGGIDSAAIAALASGHRGSPVHGFTADIAGSDPAYSERAKAAEIAHALGVTHHVVPVGPDLVAETIETASRHRGAPLSEFNDIAFLQLAKSAREHVKVVLCGEGADELFGGYPRYWGERLRARLPAPARSLLSAAAGMLSGRKPKAATFARALIERDFAARQVGWFGAMSCAEARALGQDLFRDHDPFASVRDLFEPNSDPVQGAMAFDRRVWLPDNLLARGDRMTMAAPIEMRMPYLDSGVVAIAEALPTGALLKGRRGKLPLRAAVADLLPLSVHKRRKHGFRVPFGEWARGPLRQLVADRLLADRPAYADYLDRGAVRALVETHISGRPNLEKPLWALLNLEIFLQGPLVTRAKG